LGASSLIPNFTNKTSVFLQEEHLTIDINVNLLQAISRLASDDRNREFLTRTSTPILCTMMHEDVPTKE
jgi:hypothetical protein